MPNEPVDVCIIGSGAGGGPIARELAMAGAKVVVLEKGPWYTRSDFGHEGKLGHDEVAVCRRDTFVPKVADEPRQHVAAGRRPTKSVETFIAQCVGGGTVHMSGFVYRMHPDDFRLKTLTGGLEGSTLSDWPITYDDLAPYYDKVESVMGVSGAAGTNPHGPPRSGPYPYPAMQAHPLSGLVDAAASKLGWSTFPTPRLVLTEPKGDRGACSYHRACGSYGCDTGAKGSTLATVLADAVATGNCEIRTPAMAFELVADDDRIGGVRYYDANGQVQEQSARLVIVSATAIGSARLLLNSGVGNSSGELGKNLHFSTLARLRARFDRASLDEPHRGDGVQFLQRSMQDHYRLDETAHGRGGTMVFLRPHANPILTAERLSNRQHPRLWGAALMDELERYHREVAEVEVETFAAYMPTPGTRVELSGDLQDKWGLPVPAIHVDRHPADKQTGEALAAKAGQLFEAAGAEEIRTDLSWGYTPVLQHGTCRMGNHPTTSVLDRHCKVHDLDNLYVVDGSFMPTAGGVSTTLTILANSFRIADHLLQRLKAAEVPR